MLKISNLKIPYNFTNDNILFAASERMRIDKSQILFFKLVKKSLDLTDNEKPYYMISVLVLLSGDESKVLFNRIDKSITRENTPEYIIKEKKLKLRPVIIGCGPAGLFAGLVLAKSGNMPVIIEQGKNIDERMKDIKNLKENGILDLHSNVQFGEGGAGAYSDGKLKIGMKDPLKMFILNEMVNHGAPEEILYDEKPHIGTDNLYLMVKNIRDEIINLGGEFYFNCKMSGLIFDAGKISGIEYLCKNKKHKLISDNVILAIGNSSDETFRYLYTMGTKMQARPVSIGLRIEHPREYINKIIYKQHTETIKEAADYRMVVHLPDKTSVYTFCMCPGGEVIPATSNENSVVTNGMSFYKRNASNSNSALLVSMDEKICDLNYPLSVLDFQRKLEKLTYNFGGGGYKAPVQKLSDFLIKKGSSGFGEVLPAYHPGTCLTNFDSFLPEYITNSIRNAIIEMDEWLPGFKFPDAVLTGCETRSSSPVRILRNDKFQISDFYGLYVCGEGGGYSGGIISAAADGVKCAEAVINNA